MSSKENVNNEDNLSIHLVKGYIKNYSKCTIKDIINLCVAFYGYYSKYLVYFNDHKNWFKNIITNELKIFGKNSKNKLLFIPLTQYIDDRYQIINVGQSYGWDYRVILNVPPFLCINIITNEVHEITANSKDNNFHCLISEPLVLNEWMKHNKSPKFPLKPVLISKHSKESKERIQHNIWHKFEEYLWNLFVINRLYDMDKSIKNQEIWNVIQLLSLLYFDNYQYVTNQFKIPHLILDATDRPNSYFTKPSSYFATDDDHMMYMMTTRVYVNDNYKDFDVDKDCKAKIIEYINGESLKCECYLYVDWGQKDRGYFGGCDTNLYCVIFEIKKPFNDVIINFNADVIKRYEYDGEIFACFD